MNAHVRLHNHTYSSCSVWMHSLRSENIDTKSASCLCCHHTYKASSPCAGHKQERACCNLCLRSSCEGEQLSGHMLHKELLLPTLLHVLDCLQLISQTITQLRTLLGSQETNTNLSVRTTMVWHTHSRRSTIFPAHATSECIESCCLQHTCC